ncbi:MAG: LysE family translocator [Paracoccaceae bacterium]|nr:LysE family translocator [Paracoccaceae bacterium]MDE3120533.1 LysE family translocator [Paracoccaceae bacterium]MDE3239733.1 LysE family translocator [Paracoccaceae bacterium]
MLHLLLSFPPGHLATFIAGGLVLNFVPGADVIFATASGIRGGPRVGALAGLGVGCGVLMHVTLAALGVSAAIAAWPGALSAIRWVGAGYLLFLGWKSWRATGELPQGRGAGGGWQAVRRGFVSNATNPKPMLFMIAFLPQFTDPHLGPVWEQIVLLGGIFAFTGTLVTMGYGILAGYVRHALSRKMAALNRVAAVMFGGLALRLILD